MRSTPVPIGLRGASCDDLRSVDQALSLLGLRQRESLCRGLAFVFVLALSCLILIYAPAAGNGPDGALGPVRVGHSASQPGFAGHGRTAAAR